MRPCVAGCCTPQPPHRPRRAASLSLPSIAATAGTSTTAVYSLFGGKAELLTAVLDDGFASFAASQQEVAAAGLEALGRAYRTWALGHPILYGLMFGGSLAGQVLCRPTPGATEPSIAPLFAAVAAALPGAADDEIASMVAVVWGQVHGLVHWSWPVHRLLAGSGMWPMMPLSARLAARCDAREH